MHRHFGLSQEKLFKRLVEREGGIIVALKYLHSGTLGSDRNFENFKRRLHAGGDDSVLAQFLTDPSWQAQPQSTSFFEGLLSRGSPRLITTVLSDPYWQSHPKFYEYLQTFYTQGHHVDAVNLLMESEVQERPESMSLLRTILQQHIQAGRPMSDFLRQPMTDTTKGKSWITTWIQRGVVGDQEIRAILEDNIWIIIFGEDIGGAVSVESLKSYVRGLD